MLTFSHGFLKARGIGGFQALEVFFICFIQSNNPNHKSEGHVPLRKVTTLDDGHVCNPSGQLSQYINCTNEFFSDSKYVNRITSFCSPHTVDHEPLKSFNMLNFPIFVLDFLPRKKAQLPCSMCLYISCQCGWTFQFTDLNILFII